MEDGIPGGCGVEITEKGCITEGFWTKGKMNGEGYK